MKLLSFNILADKFSAHTLISSEHTCWDNRFAKIKEMLISHDAEIVALQEVDKPAEITAFMTSIGYNAYAKKVTNMSPLIFAKKTIPQEPIKMESIVPKEFTNGHTKIAIVDTIYNNEPLRVISVHLKARLSQEDIRLAQLELIKSHFTSNTILLGDFNAYPDSKTIETLLNQSFISVYPLNENLISYSLRSQDKNDANELYYQEYLFDYIFYNNSKIQITSKIALLTKEMVKNTLPKFGIPHLDVSPSDHFVIGCEMQIIA